MYIYIAYFMLYKQNNVHQLGQRVAWGPFCSSIRPALSYSLCRARVCRQFVEIGVVMLGYVLVPRSGGAWLFFVEERKGLSLWLNCLLLNHLAKAPGWDASIVHYCQLVYAGFSSYVGIKQVISAKNTSSLSWGKLTQPYCAYKVQWEMSEWKWEDSVLYP